MIYFCYEPTYDFLLKTALKLEHCYVGTRLYTLYNILYFRREFKKVHDFLMQRDHIGT